MAGVGVKEIKNVEITTTDGKKIKQNDLIVICIKGQDIVCRFLELDKKQLFCNQAPGGRARADQVPLIFY